MAPREHPTELFPQDKITVTELIKASLHDGKIDGEDLARLQEIQKRFEQDKSKLGAQIKTELAKAKTEMLESGFSVRNQKDYEAFQLVAKMAYLGQKFPSYETITQNEDKSITIILSGDTFWVYNYGSRAYATFGKDQDTLTSNWAYFNEGKTSNNNSITLPADVLAKLDKRESDMKELMLSIETMLANVRDAKTAGTITEETQKNLGVIKDKIDTLSKYGYDVSKYTQELDALSTPQKEEAEPLPAVLVSLNNKGPIKLSDKTKAVLTGLVANPESPTMSELTAIFKKYVDNTNLYNGKDSSITADDHIRITYAVQLALNHINGGGDLQIDGARGPKSLQAIKNFQKSVGFKESNPDEPAKVTDGIPGAATIAEILKKLETSPVAVS